MASTSSSEPRTHWADLAHPGLHDELKQCLASTLAEKQHAGLVVRDTAWSNDVDHLLDCLAETAYLTVRDFDSTHGGPKPGQE